eukprot:657218-Amorphochlora_amoeboformis.AAC.1
MYHTYKTTGVTESDWRALAIASLSALRTDIARKISKPGIIVPGSILRGSWLGGVDIRRAFIRIRDVRYIELLER